VSTGGSLRRQEFSDSLIERSLGRFGGWQMVPGREPRNEVETRSATGALRAALAAGLRPEQIAMVAGGQLERLLGGAEPLDLGPAPAAPAPGPGPLLERVHTLLVAAAARLTAGYPAEEYLELARLACQLPAGHADAAAATSVRDLLDRHAAYLATDPPRRGPRVPGIHLIFVAAAIARTPELPVPAPRP
jgi:hypothetical protein